MNIRNILWAAARPLLVAVVLLVLAIWVMAHSSGEAATTARILTLIVVVFTPYNIYLRIRQRR